MSQSKPTKRLFILDGASYAYRSFYAIQRLSNSQGFPTNAVFGFLRTLKKLIADFHPDHLAAVFDPKGPTHRHEMYDEYKIQRKPMPDDLIIQMPVIKELLETFGIPVFEVPMYEGDDVMATIARKAEREGFEVFLATGDKDMFQLVTDNIKVLHTHKDNAIYGPKEVVEKFGITPGQFVDYLALAGDTSDNVPGIPGIGEKTALELIRRYGTMNGVFEHVDEISGAKRKDKIRSNRDKAEMSRELVTLKDEVGFEIDLERARFTGPTKKELMELCRRLGFRRDYEELLSETVDEDVETDYKLVTTLDDFRELVKNLRSVKEVCIDTETTSRSPMLAKVVGISFSWKKGEAYYVPFNAELDSDMLISELGPVLEDPKLAVIGQNIKYDYLVLRNAGIELKNVAFDTMIAAYLIEPSRSSFSLRSLAIEYLRRKMVPISDLIGTGKKQLTMDQVPIDTVFPYACADAEVTFVLKGILEKELERQGLTSLFRDMEMPLVLVLAEMELTGVCVDIDFLRNKSKEFEGQLADLQQRIYDAAGGVFNINSPKQLSVILFEKLGLPVQRRTKTGPSPDISVLEKLSAIHELPKLLLEYRHLAKLKSTYIDALPELVNPGTKRIHTSFNQTVTTTGRLSSSNPNLQNIPVRTEEGKEIRRAFIPSDERWKLISADYSQIELRIFAHLAGETEMIKAFQKGEDIHSYTASLIHDVPLDKVTDEMRYRAKAVNFGLIYGQQAYGLSNYLKISVSEAQRFIDQYLERYPNVKSFMDETIKAARERGYVTTLFGRRRYVPELKSSSRQTQQLGERIAVNTPIQGSAADIIKIAMIRIPPGLRKSNLRAKMILQIHDELLFEAPEDEVEQVKRIALEEMESVAKLSVPLKVDTRVGDNWKDV